jgi:hypothetical protein
VKDCTAKAIDVARLSASAMALRPWRVVVDRSQDEAVDAPSRWAAIDRVDSPKILAARRQNSAERSRIEQDFAVRPTATHIPSHNFGWLGGPPGSRGGRSAGFRGSPISG